MSQHDFEIANQTFPAFRSDLNNALQALVSSSAGASEPTTTFAYQLWYDSTNDLLKMRNADDDAWITLFSFNQSTNTVEVSGEELVDDTTPQLGGDLDTNGNDINFGDSDKAQFGAGNDLQIYHDGTNSFISDQGSGNLKLLAGNFRVRNAGDTENIIEADQNGAVTAYYDNSPKLATTSTGVDVTGTVTADNVGINEASPDTKLHIKAGSNSETDWVTTLQNSAGSAVAELGAYGYNHNLYHRFYIGDSEKARIDSSGNLLVGTTSTGAATASNGAYITPDGQIIGRSDGIVVYLNRRSTDGQILQFMKDGTSVGSIYVTASSTSYNTSSDYRLKENAVALTGAITRVKSLQPKRFNFISDDSITVDGFMAHEAQSVVPEAVTGAQNEVETWTQDEIDAGDAPANTSAGDNKLDDDGNTIPIYQGIDQSKLVPLLTGALQEAITKIETLETEMTALKARVTTLESA